MPLVQINAIREILEDAEQRIGAIDPTPLPMPVNNALILLKDRIAHTVALVLRVEERLAKFKATQRNAPEP